MISVPHTCIYNTLIPDINQLGPIAPKHGNLYYLCAVHYICSHVGGSGGMLPQNFFLIWLSECASQAFWEAKFIAFIVTLLRQNNYVRFLPNLTTLNTLESFTSPKHSLYAFILAENTGKSYQITTVEIGTEVW